MDYFSLTRAVTEGVFSTVIAPNEFVVDPSRLGFWGHSQGATTGPLFLAFEPDIDIATLSGAGAGVVQGLLRKRSPVDIKRGVFAVLREEADEGHPVLNLMQQYFAPVDPLNYGSLLARKPIDIVSPPHHLLVVYGQGDTFTPPLTTRIFSDVLDIPVVLPALDTELGKAFDGYLEAGRVVEAPMQGNKSFETGAVTMGMIHHPPQEYDGHFVAFQNAAAATRISRFFDSFFSDGVAVIDAVTSP
jgi:hypothetical protein